MHGSLIAVAALGAAVALGVTSSNAAEQSALNGCTSNTPFNGELTTPSFSTGGSASPVLSFQTWWEVESVVPFIDSMAVEGSINGGTWQLVQLLNENLPPDDGIDPPEPTGRPDAPFSNIGFQRRPEWETVTIALPSEYGLQSDVRLRFAFKTGDSFFNGFRGWGIDAVTVTGESVDVPLPFQGFEGEGVLPSGWEATGFWNAVFFPEGTFEMSEDINGRLVTLGTGVDNVPDDGHLPFGFQSDGYAWFGQPSTGTFCGEHFRLQLVLDPLAAQLPVGSDHTVTASIQDNIIEGTNLIWSVFGANPTGPNVIPAEFGSGSAPITWTGANAGLDTLQVYIDLDGNEQPGQDELVRTAQVEFVSPTTEQPPAEQPPAEQPPAQQPPAEQQPTQEGPRQEQPPRDPFPPDIPTAPTLDALPDPDPFEEINVEAESGRVFVRLPGGRGGAARASQAGAPSGFIPLTQAAQVPVNSIMEASRGRVSLESTADARGQRMQRADFFAGRFQIRQPRARNPVTEMVLKGGSFSSCPRATKSASGDPQADASQRRGRRVRRVWGSGRGRFRTRGRYSSATVRGTTWLTEDTCNGTLTRVAARPPTNRVVVRDLVRRRSRLLRAGQSYFAARPLRRR